MKLLVSTCVNGQYDYWSQLGDRLAMTFELFTAVSRRYMDVGMPDVERIQCFQFPSSVRVFLLMNVGDKQLVAPEQSVHADGCDSRDGSCERLVWDPDSYKSVKGVGGAEVVGRAVVLDQNCRRITYVRASNKTLAITHVWSHGQGGRPYRH